MSLADLAAADLERLRQDGLLRAPPTLDSALGPDAILDGRPVVVFCSNDYLGLTVHPELRRALVDLAATHATGAGASRLVSGTHRAHDDAERSLAAFVGAPRALLFSTGYAANVGVLQALASRHDLILSDELNHASLIDGCRLSRAATFVYPHRDLAAVERLFRAQRGGHRRAFLVTDGLFSMDGDLAPLAKLRALTDRYDAALVVDEAHSLGVLGPGGRGLCAAADLEPDLLIGTLGKAFGLAGAFVAGPHPTVELVLQRARSFVFSTAPLPLQAAAIPKACALVAAADDRRTRVLAHAGRLRAALSALGFRVGGEGSPIVPVHVGAPEPTMALSHALLEQGFFVQGIRPPTVPTGTGRLRLVPTAAHTDAHLDRLLAAFERLGSPP